MCFHRTHLNGWFYNTISYILGERSILLSLLLWKQHLWLSFCFPVQQVTSEKERIKRSKLFPFKEPTPTDKEGEKHSWLSCSSCKSIHSPHDHNSLLFHFFFFLFQQFQSFLLKSFSFLQSLHHSFLVSVIKLNFSNMYHYYFYFLHEKT